MPIYRIYAGFVPSSILVKIAERCKELYGVREVLIWPGIVRLDITMPLTASEKEFIRRGIPVGIIIREVVLGREPWEATLKEV